MWNAPQEKLNIQNPVWHTFMPHRKTGESVEDQNPDGIIWQKISLANRRLTGCWKSKIIGGDGVTKKTIITWCYVLTLRSKSPRVQKIKVVGNFIRRTFLIFYSFSKLCSHYCVHYSMNSIVIYIPP